MVFLRVHLKNVQVQRCKLEGGKKAGWHFRLFILPLCPFLKTLQILFPQDIQCVNNYSPKKVSTVFQHYFQLLHQRGIRNGKTVGEESRINLG